jgi:HAD superfamily hydrolase (TIGR01484 family)
MGRIYDASQESDYISKSLIWTWVFAFDIDGTLTEPNQDIVSEYANILSELSKNQKIIILTARDFDTVESHILSHLPKETHWNNWIIAGANGGQVAKYNGREFYEHKSIYEMPRELRSKIQADFEAIKRSWIIPDLHPWANIEDRVSNLTLVVIPRFYINNHTWEKMKISREERLWADPDKKLRRQIIHLLQECNKNIVHEYEWMIAGATSIDIKSLQALKGHNLAKVLALSEYHGESVVFFGDEVTAWGDESIPRILPNVMSIEVSWFHQTYSFLAQFLSSYETN